MLSIVAYHHVAVQYGRWYGGSFRKEEKCVGVSAGIKHLKVVTIAGINIERIVGDDKGFTLSVFIECHTIGSCHKDTLGRCDIFAQIAFRNLIAF